MYLLANSLKTLHYIQRQKRINAVPACYASYAYVSILPHFNIDEIVRYVRFPGWQQTNAGEREVKQALRKTLFKYKLHQEQDLFDRAYAYIAEYY